MDRRVVRVLEEGALVERAVPEEAGDHIVGAEQPQPERGPGRDAEAAADDTVRAEHPDREVGDVHRPALAAAAAAVSRPNSSAIIGSTATPLAMAWP